MPDQRMIERVRDWLRWPAEETPRLLALEQTNGTADRFELPSEDQARETLARIIVPAHAIDEIIAGMPRRDRDTEAWWLLSALHRQVLDVTESAIAPPWPAPVPGDGPLTRYFHLYVFLAAVQHVLGLHAARNVPTDVTWDTLGDVGLQVANYQARNGRPGFDGAFWIWQHFRGGIFRLGRLQYNFWTITFDPPEGAGFRRGDPCLGVHIPAAGRLDPQGCDDSLSYARTFFAEHFPERPSAIGTCSSWLLDEQLSEYLPADSNIIRFQRRFTHASDWSMPGNRDVQLFVFGRIPASLDELPQRTSVERAIVSHIRSGREWKIRQGWLEL